MLLPRLLMAENSKSYRCGVARASRMQVIVVFIFQLFGQLASNLVELSNIIIAQPTKIFELVVRQPLKALRCKRELLALYSRSGSPADHGCHPDSFPPMSLTLKLP